MSESTVATGIRESGEGGVGQTWVVDIRVYPTCCTQRGAREH